MERCASQLANTEGGDLPDWMSGQNPSVAGPPSSVGVRRVQRRTMRWEKHDDVLTYQGHTRTIQSLGWWCTDCDEGILTGAALVAHAKAFANLKAEVDGVLAPDEVAAIREKLKLSQRKAGALLGGGPRGFQKYESGTQVPSVSMSHLLRLLASDPKRLREITASTKKRAG
jgi:HTH-type transcriptional regulator / antitoxin MqsA